MNLPTLHHIRHTERTTTRRRLVPRLATLTLLTGSLFGGLGLSHASHADDIGITILQPAGTLGPDATINLTYTCPDDFPLAGNPQSTWSDPQQPVHLDSSISEIPTGYYGSRSVRVLLTNWNPVQSTNYQFSLSCHTPDPHPGWVNDTDPGIKYYGSWYHQVNRPSSFNDYYNDVHDTATSGDSLSFSFYGTGITYYGEKSADEGDVAVQVDGYGGIVHCYDGTLHNAGGQALYSISGLTRGWHTLWLVNYSNAYMVVDAFQPIP